MTSQVLATIGGSGSHRLMEALGSRLRVADKPDNVLRPNYHTLWAGRFGTDQGRFVDRSLGFEWKAGPWLESGFVDFMRWVDTQQSYALVSGTFAELGLFSRHRVPGVIFIVRDPVQTLLSWAKPYRHGDVVDYLGGPNSPACLEFIASRWNRHAAEALRLRHLGILGGLIRFETAPADAARLGLEWAFDDFCVDRRSRPDELTSESIEYLDRTTREARAELYR